MAAGEDVVCLIVRCDVGDEAADDAVVARDMIDKLGPGALLQWASKLVEAISSVSRGKAQVLTTSTSTTLIDQVRALQCQVARDTYTDEADDGDEAERDIELLDSCWDALVRA